MEPDAAADHPHTRRSAGDRASSPESGHHDLSEYTAALQEVQRQGEVHSAARAADQTQVANVSAAPIQNYWNEIAQTAALGTTLAGNSRLSFSAALERRV